MYECNVLIMHVSSNKRHSKKLIQSACTIECFCHISMLLSVLGSRLLLCWIMSLISWAVLGSASPSPYPGSLTLSESALRAGSETLPSSSLELGISSSDREWNEEVETDLGRSLSSSFSKASSASSSSLVSFQSSLT